MDILWINEYASFKGGCETYIYETAKLLRASNFHSKLLYDARLPIDPLFLQAFDETAAIEDLKGQIEKFNPDIIYVHQLWDIPSTNILAECRQPVIRYFHDLRIIELRQHRYAYFPWMKHLVRASTPLGFRIRLYKELQEEQRINKRLNAFVVGSDFMKEKLLKQGFESFKVHKIPLYALPPIHPKQEKEPGLIIFAGQLVHAKGLDLALKALKEVKHPFKLIVAGEGANEESYKTLAKHLKIDHQVEFVGHLNKEQLEALYNRAVCALYPVREGEPFGLVGPEAMRYGTPVIATAEFGIKEWMEEGVNGIFTPLNDIQSLTDALNKILGDPEFAKKLSQSSLDLYRRKYTPKNHLEALINLFQSYYIRRDKEIYSKWGRFTPTGTEEVEECVDRLVKDAIQIVQSLVPAQDIKAFLLIGGYGKGEGGVEVIYGNEIIHNNLDFLLVTHHNISKGKKQELQSKIQKLAAKNHIGIDFSIIDAKRLQRSSHLLIWYDMVEGHKLLLGNEKYIQSLPFHDLSTLNPQDIQKMMVNRGTLLLINDALITQNPMLDTKIKKTVIKHIMKAIIGFGDALLYFLGDYHWSYQQKELRMRQRQDVDVVFKNMYFQASEFRLYPQYHFFLSCDVKSWNNKILDIIQGIYLQCEAKRLNQPNLTWENYFENYSHHLLINGEWKSKIKGVLHPTKKVFGGSKKEIISFMLQDPKSRFAGFFPLVAFSKGNYELQKQAMDYLNARTLSRQDMINAYLKSWSTHGDVNFPKFIKEFNLDL